MGNRGALLRIVFGVIGLIVTLSLFVTMLGGFADVLNASVAKTDTADNVTTAEGVNEADVTLTYSLLSDDVDNVASITSTIETDNAVADSYSALTLTVGNLTDNVSVGDGRTLTINYSHGILSYFTGLESVLVVGPVILFLTLVFGSSALIVSGIRKSRGGKS